jgi:MFS family permease
MLRLLFIIALFFVIAATIIYMTERLRKRGPFLLTAVLGGITTFITSPVLLILLLMYATGGAGEKAYAWRELHWLWPICLVGALMLGISLMFLKRSPSPPDKDAPPS